ncbi:MAG: ROK family protein [bacterium]|nr:ROK family protein [bacterium]
MYIGIDIGGTHIRVATGKNGKIEEKIDFPTREFHASIQEIKEAVEKLSSGTHIQAVGVGIPGFLNLRKGMITHSPNLVGWDHIDIADIFSKVLVKKVFVNHDASVAALGEATYGAGKGKNPVLYFTVSTGVGSGLVINGKIFHGIFNPEAGHQILSREGRAHPGAPAADLESLVSGSAFQRVFEKTSAEMEGSEAWFQALDWLAIGLTNTILHFSPEIVVIGGGMTKHREIFFAPLKKALRKYLRELPEVPVVPSGLGQESGIVGALTLAEKNS